MGRTRQDVTDKELEILQVLWDQGSVPIRVVADVVYPGGGTSGYATVQKLLERLEEKGYICRDRRPAAHLISAVVGRDELIGRRLEDVADKLCGGSLTPLLTHLVRARRLSSRERQELRALIEELDRQTNKGKS